VPAFRVKLGANDLNCVDVPLNLTYLLTLLVIASLTENIDSLLQCCRSISKQVSNIIYKAP